MKNILKLIRVTQWYKNLLVFAALFFSGNFLNIDLAITTLLGFFLLSIISSAGYIMNDFIDRKKDSLNPEKKNRVLANGKVSIKLALSISLIFYFLGFILSYVLSVQFFFIVLLIALITIIYSLWLKHCEFLDIILISSNFILRALAGVVLISVVLSPWFFLGIFSLAFF
ncbi:hypothetical protein C0585_02945 [Candidatus Woesearchaeota archaeon]|nr:MAG: hypothetical protein C0585_02945 [Candidatus Woesearchaeota archaeon]